jgi:hypothetical protein
MFSFIENRPCPSEIFAEIESADSTSCFPTVTFAKYSHFMHIDQILSDKISESRYTSRSSSLLYIIPPKIINTKNNELISSHKVQTITHRISTTKYQVQSTKYYLWHFDRIQYIIHNIFRSYIFRFGFVSDCDAVTQNIIADCPNIFGNDISTPFDERECLRP